MSHVCSVELQINDIAALAAAAKRLGLEFRKGQTTFRWYGEWMDDWADPTRAAAMKGHDPAQFGSCIHALSQVKPTDGNPYEIGVIHSKDGKGYELIYDAWASGHGLEARAGQNLKKLRQEYTAEVSAKHLRKQGYAVQRTVDSKGNLIIQGIKP